MSRTGTLIVGALTLACGASLSASLGIDRTPREQIKTEPEVTWVGDRSFRFEATSAAPLRVENVRLEAPPRTETGPSTLLKFDLFNASPNRLTDLLLEVSITQRATPDPTRSPGRMLVRPFKIRGNVILEAGFTINYEMLLRHFSSDCDCVANVNVLSVRPLPDSD